VPGVGRPLEGGPRRGGVPRIREEAAEVNGCRSVTSDPGRPGRLLRRGRTLVIVGYALREAREIFGR
jgi:hypothetical protein